MEKNGRLQKLICKCRSAVHVSFNEHKDYDLTVKEFLLNNDVSTTIRNMMIEKDTVIVISFYSNKSNKLCTVFHYNLDSAASKALKIL